MIDEEDHNRLEELERGIEKFKSATKQEEIDKKQKMNISALGLSLELVSAIFVGSLIGYTLDRYLNTKPLLFIICFILGSIAGCLTIYRTIKNFEQSKKE